MDNLDRLNVALVKAFSENLSQGAFIARLTKFHSKPEPRSEINRAYCRVQGMGVLVFSKPFVEATYQLESDGPLSLFAFEIIDRVAVDIKEHFPTLAYPELQKTVADLCAGDPEYSKALLDNIKSILMPAKDYFHAKLIVKLKPQLELFKAAALTNPQYMQRTDPFVADVEATLLRLVQHASAIVDADGVAKLVAELTTYKQRVSNVRWKADIPGTCYATKAEEVRLFWQRERLMLPAWHGFVSIVAIIAPSCFCGKGIFDV